MVQENKQHNTNHTKPHSYYSIIKIHQQLVGPHVKLYLVVNEIEIENYGMLIRKKQVLIQL